MPETVVPCPACGAATAVETGGAAPCPRCGFLVSARPRVRAERDEPAPRRGAWLPVAVGAGLVVAAGGVAAWTYSRRVEAERFERQARQEALAAEDRAWAAQQAARDRAAWQARIDALPAELPALLPGGALPPEEAEERAAALADRAVGAWRGPGPDGGTRVVVYREDGTFRDAVVGGPAPREWAGEWAVGGLTGSRVLHVTRTGGGPESVKLSFEGDELVHDDEPGRATVLRRQ